MAVPARTVLENGPRIRPCPHKTKYIRSPRPEVRNVPTPTLMPPADRPESNAAHTAAFPPRLGQGPRLAHVSLRAMEWPFRRTTTSKHGDWARRRPSSGRPYRPPGSVHASGSAMASRARRLGRLARRRPGHRGPRRVTSPGLALSGRYRAGGAGPGQPLPAGRGRRPRRCGPGHTRYQPAQPAADAPPDRRLHGRTVAQALGDANVCYNPSPASDGLRHIRRPRRQAAGLPAVPARS